MLYGGWSYGQSLSPEVISTAGDHFATANAQLSWTLGEPIIETLNGSGAAMLTQGFHQTNLMVTALEDLAVDFQVRVYPNPTVGWLNVEAEEAPAAFGLELFDATGRLLRSSPVEPESGLRTLDLSGYAPGLYLLRLHTQGRKTIKTFKVFKIN